ncbi:beta-1,4-N-acetylgalactosaminyltransferase 3-like [Denticeps clupeoides]|uniref:beta-1,4-N-acetylgalactosaminyltransferase 3-like n=1 Tax=Denticeps clupeoides TaxID=299321 RepID=UPI0010A3B462|nr:beta-1,4-N-acetylgalactosaminyltransferase 3-like [Denticeps clupeoides]
MTGTGEAGTRLQMRATALPARKLLRSSKYAAAALLLLALLTGYLYLATSGDTYTSPTQLRHRIGSLSQFSRRERPHSYVSEDKETWIASYSTLPWNPEHNGRANLHVFEDWCGGSIKDLRRNLHFPTYPHVRSTVHKLALAPRWHDYGLRLFGYLHPPSDGEFVFAVGSDDNSEFWLSSDETPSSLKLQAYVGETGAEWTAPGEFEKYSSQVSKPIKLLAKQKYYFELLHKQDDKGTDHVEVGWKLKDSMSPFSVVDSQHISLYCNESFLKMSDVSHIPQTEASHTNSKFAQATPHGADMLRDDPRDTFHQIPLLDPSHLVDVLPACQVESRFSMKGYSLSRYQGLQFVRLTHVYPNDFTRLTHMEQMNKCFYRAVYSPRFGFALSMQLDGQKDHQMFRGDSWRLRGGLKNEMMVTEDNYQFKNQRRLFSLEEPKSAALQDSRVNTGAAQLHPAGLQNPSQAEDQAAKETSRLRERLQMAAPRHKYHWWGYEKAQEILYDPEVNWAQTFKMTPMDLQKWRDDWLDLSCNVSGNILLGESEALALVSVFMEKLNSRSHRQYTLYSIVNVEKRVSRMQSSRYLLELELLDGRGQKVRLSQYVKFERSHFQLSKKEPLCWPQRFQWNPNATVHFIVPVKNQARWVQQFISDMEELYTLTSDKNFNVIITDFNSTDMDVHQTLRNSRLPRYDHVLLSGDFERAAGLQAGIDLIKDEHSIIFLCDLHIHFPAGFVDTIRRHCVESSLVFAPVVIRLNCGATPQEPDGYWEMNGFGLLGIYKSDLVALGGMNTEEFKNRWGGEDWELLDRIIEAGLDVDRLHIRNFHHYYHSKRGMWNRRILPMD